MNTHHAHLIWANSLDTSSVPDIYKIQSADVLHIVNERFAIDDARELSRLSQQKSFNTSERVFIVVTNDIAIEAQNALLKLFEEPPEDVLFYIVVKKTAFLLPTLRSRLSEYADTEGEVVADTNEAFASFVSATYAERIVIISEKTKEKDSVWIEDILCGCEKLSMTSPEVHKKLLETIVFVREYTSSKGASLKMLLEEIALSISTK